MKLSVNGEQLNPSEFYITRQEIIPDDLLTLERPQYEYSLQFEFTGKVFATMDVTQEMMDKLIRPLQPKAHITIYNGEESTEYVINRRDYKRNRLHLIPAY